MRMTMIGILAVSLWGCDTTDDGHDHNHGDAGGAAGHGAHGGSGGSGGHGAHGGAGGHAAHGGSGGSGGHGAHGGAGGHAMGGSGGGQGHVDIYVAGLEKVGAHGHFTLRLVESDPIPRDTGLYTWRVSVLDAQGNPVSGAMVRAEPTMPAHGHGTNPRYTDGVEAADSPGTYTLSDMDLFMPGVWMVAIQISVEGGAEDMVMYHFDIDG